MNQSSGKIIELDSEPRGCGNLVEGALYMGAQLGSDVLASWAWMLGKLWDSDDGESIRYSPDILPDRQQVEIDWAGTKAAGRLTDEPVKVDDDPLFAVADHIGSCHYTPMEFYRETIARGPSRRVRRDTAKLWAGNTPFPILFGHKDVPWFDSQEHAERFLDWAVAEGLIGTSSLLRCKCGWTGVRSDLEQDEEWESWGRCPECAPRKGHLSHAWDWTASWKEAEFLASGGNNGTDHPAMLVIKALELVEDDVPADCRPSSYQRVIFGASWVTRILQILDDDTELNSDLAEAGVLKAILVEEVT